MDKALAEVPLLRFGASENHLVMALAMPIMELAWLRIAAANACSPLPGARRSTVQRQRSEKGKLVFLHGPARRGTSREHRPWPSGR
jgi:hypothetical protein